MQIRMIQVGLGGWGQDWNRTILRRSDEIELVGFVDLDTGMLAAARDRLELPAERCFASIGEALGAVEADAVLITALLGAHVPVALAALQAGKHVLVEKPFAPTMEEARQVVGEAAARNLVLMVSQNYRFYPAVRAAADMVRSEELGPVDAVSLNFRRYANGNDPGTRHYGLVQPLLMDMSIHHFDLMRYVLGQEPQRVYCSAWNPPWSKFKEPAEASATIAFDGGAVVTYRGSWVSTGQPTPWAGEWLIECRDGSISLTSRADTGLSAERVSIKTNGKKAARKLAPPDLTHIDRAGTLHAFVEAIGAGREPECSGRDNLGTLGLMYAAIESSNTGVPQSIGQERA